ncbi:hypothetical protein [Corynebacterium sp.]
MFEFLGNLFQQVIEIIQLVIGYITDEIPSGGGGETEEWPLPKE